MCGGPVFTSVHVGYLCVLLTLAECRAHVSRRVPGEQRLYRALMADYEKSVRPVRNSSGVVHVNFRMYLNQIVDLDERAQVLTTSLFIHQEWTDENLQWNVSDFQGIQTLRVPASNIWLPDTFIFNNADDAATGFMRGVYVMIDHNGTVRWPVPVKLRSSCKVDIAYFPFDDQSCVLSFGSWIHSFGWMDFHSQHDQSLIYSYVDNSEWKLLQIYFLKTLQKGAYTAAVRHSALTYTLHLRRRTFYYVFNVIVPCIMLSVLTLLTFWLPPTSGEKVSLGLSVFLAFSMFMLLIAEEVPATSESVPLIGVYLTTVMTMTSLSVIMAVIVINLYNRGRKAKRPPLFLKTIVLKWMCRLLRMTHDIERLSHSIRLEDEDEARYYCPLHHGAQRSYKYTARRLRSPIARFSYAPQRGPMWASCEREGSGRQNPGEGRTEQRVQRRRNAAAAHYEARHRPLTSSADVTAAHYDARQRPLTSSADVTSDDSDAVWVLRESCKERGCPHRARHHNGTTDAGRPPTATGEDTDPDTLPASPSSACRKEHALAWRKETILEWQTMALVVDRLLFWIFLIFTVVAYLIILIILPYTKQLPPVDARSEPLLPTNS